MKTKLGESVTVVGVAAAVAENVAADAVVAEDGVAGLRDRGHEGEGWAGSVVVVVVVVEGVDLRRTVVGWVGVSGMCVEVVGSP